MKQTALQKIGFTIVRSVAVFFTFGLVALVCRLIFKGNLFDEDMLSKKAIAGWDFAFALLIFESVVFAAHRYSAEAKQVFLDRFAFGHRFGKLKSVFLTADLYVEFACVALLSVILPLSFAYDCVGTALFGANYGKAQVLPILLPILLGLQVLAHWSVRSAWVTDSIQTKATGKKDKSHLAQTVQSVAITAMIYCAAALLIPWMLPVVVTVSNLGAGAMVFVYIALALSVAALVVIAAFYVRALRKRKAFLQKLKTYCREQSVALSPVRGLYASVFLQHEGADFTLEIDHTVCDCKLVAGIFPSSPLIFGDTGTGIRQDTLRLFKVDLLHLNTILDYRMDSRPEGSEKIVIALPVPKNIYASVQGSSPRPADTGESVGEYTVYTASGFLNALERGQLGGHESCACMAHGRSHSSKE